jgi:hypothetical protein
MTDNKPILPTIDPLAYLRTAVPAAWGSLLAFLAAQIPIVAQLFTFIDQQFGEGWRQLSGFVATAAVIFGYYWVARQIGRRWPTAEKWLIGSSSQPIYVEPHADATVEVRNPSWTAEEQAEQDARDAVVSESSRALDERLSLRPNSDAS